VSWSLLFAGAKEKAAKLPIAIAATPNVILSDFMMFGAFINQKAKL